LDAQERALAIRAAGLDGAVGNVVVTGEDPVVPTPFRVGTAAALALGLVASQVGSNATVDVGRAARSLLGVAHQRLDGAPLRVLPMTDPYIGLHRTRDGRWVHLHALFPHLERRLLDVLGCDVADISPAVARWEAQPLEDELAANGACGAIVRTGEEWLAHPEGARLAELPVVEVVRIGDGPADPEPTPLGGRRVLDMTRVLAGPIAARTLAQHGATVLRIGRAQGWDSLPESIETGHGKRSAVVDLDEDGGMATLAQLVRGADVFCHNIRTGSLEQRGLGPHDLARMRPGLVYASINCYGHGGAWERRGGFEQLAQSATGLALDGADGQPPQLVPVGVCDYVTGYLVAYGILVALRRRAEEGGSWWVRGSLAQTAMWVRRLGTVDGWEAQADPLAVTPPELVTTQTPYGCLQHLPPVPHDGARPAGWSRPPTPLGAAEPRWQDDVAELEPSSGTTGIDVPRETRD
jgi:hypothetical protein